MAILAKKAYLAKIANILNVESGDFDKNGQFGINGEILTKFGEYSYDVAKRLL